MPYFQGPRLPQRSKGLSAFLAQTPEGQGGQPQTALPVQPAEDPLYPVGKNYSPPSANSAAPGAATDPATTAQVASAQIGVQTKPKVGGKGEGHDPGMDINPELIFANQLVNGMLGRDGTPEELNQARPYYQAFRAAVGRQWTNDEFEQLKGWISERYKTLGRPPTPTELYEAAKGWFSPGFGRRDPIDPGGGGDHNAGFSGGTSGGGGAAQFVPVNMERTEDGQLRFTGNFAGFGQTGGGTMSGLNLFHEILAQSGLDMGRVTVESGVGGVGGNYRITAPPEYQNAIAEALQQASNALSSTLDVGYSLPEAGKGLASGLSAALGDPNGLGQQYRAAFEGAGLQIPTEQQARGFTDYARNAYEGVPGTPPYTGPGADVLGRYYNALGNAGINTPYAAQGGRGTATGPGGMDMNRYFQSIRRFRGGGGGALSRALGGY